MKKILIIQTAFLGDVILTLPMVQTLKAHLPDSQIDFLCIPQNAPVLENHPDIHKVIEYDKRGSDKIDKFIEALSEIRQTEYDIVITPHRFFRSAMLTYYSEAKVRIGFDINSCSFLLTNKVKYAHDMHEIYRNLELLKAVPGINFDESKVTLKPHLYPSENDIKIADGFLSMHRSNLITIAPCSRWYTKQLTLNKSVEIINKLLRDGFNIAVIGGRDDADYGIELEKQINDDALVNLSGKLTHLQSYEVITKSKALIAVDSGGHHLGASSKTPVVLIYGSTDLKFGFWPLTLQHKIIANNSLNCRPCTDHGREKCPLGHFKCIEDLNAAEITEAMKQLIV